MIFGRKRKMTRSIREFVWRMQEYEEAELRKPWRERNIFCDGTDAQEVVNCLCELFLGEDWYSGCMSNAQVNTEILDNILYRYCTEYRKLADGGKKK